MARSLDGSSSPGPKRKDRGGSLTKRDKASMDPHKEQTEMEMTIETCEENDCNRELVAPKRPKRAAACSNFKEKSLRLSDKSSYVKLRESRIEEDEMVAVDLTKLGPENPPPCRKLVDFILHDFEGNPQPFEMSEIDDCFITAIIMPLDDDIVKDKDRGVKCEGFGRIESWTISGYDEGSPIVWLSTKNADYECVKPAGSYKKFYDLFHVKAQICVEVYKKLGRWVGGNPNMSLDELIAGVLRSLSWNKKFSDGLTSKDFLISLGEFIYYQLIGLDESSENYDVHFATLPTLLALRDECQNRVQCSRLPLATSNGSLNIKEGGISDAAENEDEKLARLLQEEEDWNLLMQQNGRRGATPKNFYIKISEAEIANDYPLPAYYKPIVPEMDEYIFSETDFGMSYLGLPRRILNNWALYNSDSRLISLELIPMKPCAEVDVTVFGSGFMREDDGSGYFLDAEPGQSSLSTSNSIDEGVPIYLSSVKEWMIEFGSSMIFISIRTDVAWYRLEKPTKQYVPWYETVLKTARLAVAIITLLKEQSRVSKLSFTDVIKKVSEFDKGHSAYISSNIEAVERYIVVHGQIILQQFSEYPDEMIKKSAFVIGLSHKMEQRRHTKLSMKKKVVVQKEANLNPSATMGLALSKRKVMRATTTRLINKIWGDYYANFFPEDTKDGNDLESKELEEEQEEIDEEEDADDENLTFQEEKASKKQSSNIPHRSKSECEGMTWEDEPTGTMFSGESLHASAFVNGHVISVGGGLLIEADDSEEEPTILFVEYMFEQNDAKKMVHGRILKRGRQTILGNAADERELFLTHDCLEIELGDVKESVTIDIRSRSWGHIYRKEYANADKIDMEKAEERKKKGLPIEYYCKSLYWPEKGGFFTLPYDNLGLGSGICSSCKQQALRGENFLLSSNTSFVFKNNEYNVHDFMYIRPQFLNEDKEEDRGTFKAGRNVGLKPYIVCQLLEIQNCAVPKQATPTSTQLKVRRYYRPDDISTAKAYNSDIREIYYSEKTFIVPVDMIEGKCEIQKKCDFLDLGLPVVIDHVFFCEYSYDPIKGSLNQLPSNVKLVPLKRKGASPGATKKKGKGKCVEQKQDNPDEQYVLRENTLATLDIFAGCGGLSEGLQQSGVSFTKWAIEYEEPAGEAFRHNHPQSTVFVDNCNVILRAIMEKCGDLDDCISTSEAAEMASALSEEKLKNLPIPGEVDFINGGPPCQGFSGMNRFNHGTWSKVQCEMILAFLSFAEYFRPKFFLLENVRNFVSFNKGQTFRLALASLLAMGYQVRFGILEAGAFGVSQSRKRAFIWAASPEEILPEWPEPMHVFAGSELKISMPGGSHYAAARSTSGGAPFRSITVRDTIGDLPSVQNGASKPTIDYGSEPTSWFQKQIRGNMSFLNDHISKEMNELNLIRCKHIPKLPGADWRDLPDEKVKLSTGQVVDMIPWCLPNTAKRHNQWKGLYGRLDWEGNFPTSITDPQPMGKVGMCFHPDQDRILTVRECARSQGFPDGYIFYGNIQNKHRQIGNAVPPPLAYALGRKLKEAVEAKISSSA